MFFLVATNVVASRLPERDRLERRTLVPSTPKKVKFFIFKNIVEQAIFYLFILWIFLNGIFPFSTTFFIKFESTINILYI